MTDNRAAQPEIKVREKYNIRSSIRIIKEVKEGERKIKMTNSRTNLVYKTIFFIVLRCKKKPNTASIDRESTAPMIIGGQSFAYGKRARERERERCDAVEVEEGKIQNKKIYI